MQENRIFCIKNQNEKENKATKHVNCLLKRAVILASAFSVSVPAVSIPAMAYASQAETNVDTEIDSTTQKVITIAKKKNKNNGKKKKKGGKSKRPDAVSHPQPKGARRI